MPEESGQQVAFIEVFNHNCYRLKWVASCGDIRTVLDVGANIGLFCLAARIAFPKATVHAYEPNPALKSELAGHAEAAHFKYFPEAVGAKRGTASLDAEPGHSMFGRTGSDPKGLISQVSLAEAISRLAARRIL